MIWKNKNKRLRLQPGPQSLNTAAVEKGHLPLNYPPPVLWRQRIHTTSRPWLRGEVVAAAFEEGDQVQKDQVLYEIDSSSMTTGAYQR